MTFGRPKFLKEGEKEMKEERWRENQKPVSIKRFTAGKNLRPAMRIRKRDKDAVGSIHLPVILDLPFLAADLLAPMPPSEM